jgi:DNA repair protein RecO (recombination protein O)
LDHSVKGIVLNITRYSDKSSIVKIFTHNFGLKTFSIRLSKSVKNGSSNLMQPFSPIEFESSLKENRQIHPIKNLRPSHVLASIPFDATKSTIILFLNEVVQKTMVEDYVNDELFQFLNNAIILLDDAVDARNFHLWCLLEITRHYGFYPLLPDDSSVKVFDLKNAAFIRDLPGHKQFVAGEEVGVMISFLEKEWPEVQSIQLHSQLRSNLLNMLVQFIQLHLENNREIKSLAVLHAVFH